jgi:hypothetical protein
MNVLVQAPTDWGAARRRTGRCRFMKARVFRAVVSAAVLAAVVQSLGAAVKW